MWKRLVLKYLIVEFCPLLADSAHLHHRPFRQYSPLRRGLSRSCVCVCAKLLSWVSLLLSASLSSLLLFSHRIFWGNVSRSLTRFEFLWGSEIAFFFLFWKWLQFEVFFAFAFWWKNEEVIMNLVCCFLFGVCEKSLVRCGFFCCWWWWWWWCCETWIYFFPGIFSTTTFFQSNYFSELCNMGKGGVLATCCDILIAILLPPLGVFLKYGCMVRTQSFFVLVSQL
jgi:hypothetical protein